MDSQTQSPIDLLISRLRRCGCEPEECGPGQWKSRCPLHDGSKKNLGIKDCGGTLLLNCLHIDASGGRSCLARCDS